MDNNFRIGILKEEQCEEAADIFFEEGGLSFLSLLGPRFFINVLKSTARSKWAFGLVCLGGERVVGVTLAATDLNRYYADMFFKKGILLFFWAFKELVKDKNLIKKAFDYFLFPIKIPRQEIKAQWLNLSVKKEYRNKGIGKKLTLSLIEEFRKRNIERFGSTVFLDNKVSRSMHDKYGFKSSGTFQFGKERLESYICNINEGKDAYSPKEKAALIETGNYIYTNLFTRRITLKAHKTCAGLRRFDNGLVVDLGCGRGDHFPFIKNSKIIGIDVIDEFLEEAKRQYPAAELRKESIFDLSFETGSLKSIISFGVLEHLSPLNKALEEIKRVMADDGEFIFGIPTEGLLYRIGRNLITKPHVEKTTGVDYNTLLKKEHINRCRGIIIELKRHFIIDRLKGVPFKLRSIDPNIFLIGRCIKK